MWEVADEEVLLWSVRLDGHVHHAYTLMSWLLQLVWLRSRLKLQCYREPPVRYDRHFLCLRADHYRDCEN